MPPHASIPEFRAPQFRLPRGAESFESLRLCEELERRGLNPHGVIVVQHGHVVGEKYWAPYSQHLVHELYSVTKSFMSTAVGFAVAEGLLNLDDRVVDLFPESLPDVVSENLAAMKLRHLLSMSTGQVADDWSDLWSRPDGDWIAGFLSREVVHEPGTFFLYNTAASYVAGAAVELKAGVPLDAYLKQRLFDPLGFGEYKWEKCPFGRVVGGYGLSLQLEDLAKFGELYRLEGFWHNHRLLPAGWSELATSFHVSNGTELENDWHQGYGFQFWRCRDGAFRGDGAFGQFIVVIPEREITIAILSNTPDMQATLNVIWEFFSPRRIASVRGHRRSTFSAFGEWFDLQENPLQLLRLRLIQESDQCTLLELVKENSVERIRVGHGHWESGESHFRARQLQPYLSKGGWTTESDFKLTLCYLLTPFHPTLALHFDENAVELTVEGQVGFIHPPSPVTVRGQRR